MLRRATAPDAPDAPPAPGRQSLLETRAKNYKPLPQLQSVPAVLAAIAATCSVHWPPLPPSANVPLHPTPSCNKILDEDPLLRGSCACLLQGLCFEHDRTLGGTPVSYHLRPSDEDGRRSSTSTSHQSAGTPSEIFLFSRSYM